MKFNELSLNYKQNVFMLMKYDPKLVTSFLVKIGNNQTAHIDCTKFLGVILDVKLSLVT